MDGQRPHAGREPGGSPHTEGTRTGRFAFSFAAAALFLLMFTLVVTSMAGKSPTFDEQGFIVRGLGYARGANRHMHVGHPLGLNLLNATLLIGDSQVQLPTGDPSWLETSFHRPAELFLWEIGNNVEHIIFLARMPTVWLALLLAAVVARWARELVSSSQRAVGGQRSAVAGLFALALIALDPNILAHAGLATTDLGLAAAATLAGYTLWRFLRWPGVKTAALAGIGMGLLQNTKFTALLFVPLFGLVLVCWMWRRSNGAEARRSRGEEETERIRDWEAPQSMSRNLRSAIGWLVVYGLFALLALWATNGFQVGRVPDELPMLPQLAGMTIPLAHYFEQLLDIGGRLQVSTPSFLAGRYSDQGWWYYFPVAFLLKTPLPTLVLLLLAAVLALRRRTLPEVANLREDQRWLDLALLLIPPIGYFAIALTSEINLGYRHLLPVLPFLYLFVVTTLVVSGDSRPRPLPANNQPVTTYRTVKAATTKLRWVVGLCLLALTLTTLWVYPNFLAYFNLLAGGPQNGWHWLVDSNIDWGQDLGLLKAWMDDHDVDHVWLSYFGEGRPEYYGIDYTGLDSFPPRLMNPEARPFYPHDPAPGIYAISVTNLQGVHFADHDQFAWFRDREPIANVGNSILIYEVETRGRPAELLLGGVQLDELTTADFALLGTNAITPRWIDTTQSWLLPESDNVWLALEAQQTIHPLLAGELNLQVVAESSDYTLYRVGETATIRNWMANPSSDRSSPHPSLAIFTGQEGGQIELLGYKILSDEMSNEDSGDTVLVLTTWRQADSSLPVKTFVHLLRPDGTIAGQYDGLGVAWEGWRTDDLLLQLHRIPADLPPGEYTLTAGLYDPETVERWTAESQGVVILEQIKWPIVSEAE